MRKLLAVKPRSADYIGYEVTVASSFEQAKHFICRAEQQASPFDALDLPVNDESAFWAFFRWMEESNRKYGFSIHDYKNDKQFIQIRDHARARGFHFNS